METVLNQTFYGRQKYLSNLYDIFDDQSQATPQFILIGGVAGIGKTSLVEHFLAQKLGNRDMLLQGKYDENKASIPYQGIIDAIHNYAHELSKTPKEIRNSYGKDISNLLEPNLKILLELIPEFESITGKAADIQQLPPLESHNRFLLVINKLLQFIHSNNDRVVLYIDDLHWADKASMKLLESILQNDKLSSSIIIGTYRFEEVGIGHALASSIRDISKLSGKVHRLDLPELDKSEISKIINGTILINENQLPELTDYLYEKSSGNPLYLKELINTMQLTELSNHANNDGINIDISLIKQLNISKSIIDLLILKFKKLSSETQQLLKFAACIGTFFDSKILSDLFEISLEHVENILQGGIEYGIVNYAGVGNGNKRYNFSHDRVRESAYEMIENKPHTHLLIARFLYKENIASHRDISALDDVVYHFNAGNQLITTPDEKLTLCQLNLTAAHSAKNSGAYTVAINNLQIARKLLPVDSWTIHHELTYEIYKNLAECYYLDGNFQAAEELCHLSLERISDVIEKAEIYNIKVIELTNLGDWASALNEGLEGLKLFGIDLGENLQLDSITERINKLSQAEILNSPTNNDPKIASILSLMNSMVSPVYVLRPDLIQNLVVLMLQISIDNGNSTESAYAYDIYGILLGPVQQNYVKAHEFAQLALKLNDKFNDSKLRCKIKLTYANNINIWVNSIKDNYKILEEATLDGINSGDIVNSGYCQISNILQLFAAGEKLATVKNYINANLPFLRKTHNPVISITEITRQLILNLEGKTTNELSLTNEFFDENNSIISMKENGFLHGIHWFYVGKMLLTVINDDFTDALEFVEGSKNCIIGAVGQFSVADHNFYHSLILTRLITSASRDEVKKYYAELDSNQAQLNVWANTCQANFLHKYLLVQAECSKLEKNFKRAESLYKQSRTMALENGFTQDAAICCERFASASKELMNDDARAKTLLAEAREYYLKWGAIRKT